MIVVIRELHLTGRQADAFAATRALDRFALELAELTIRAGWRSDGSYRPLEAIDLILLGDVLDLTGADLWLAGDARPWHDPHAPEVFEAVARIARQILAINAAGLSILRALAGAVAPAADAESPDSPGTGRLRLPVPNRVRLHYLVGDRDWPLHLPGPRYDRLRALVAAHLGLANSAEIPFPHDPGESAPLAALLRRHRVIARHGDIFDPIHFDAHRDASSLGDAIAIELVARFQAAVEQEFGAARLPRRARPVSHPRQGLPATDGGGLDRAGVGIALSGDRPAVENRSAVGSRRGTVFGPRFRPFAHGVATGQPDRQFGRCLDARSSRGIAEDRRNFGVARRRATGGRSIRRSACPQCARESRRYARFVVYGHRSEAAGASPAANVAATSAATGAEFQSGALSYLAFYQGDERGGIAFESSPGLRRAARSARRAA